jgi:hypothetical protein
MKTLRTRTANKSSIKNIRTRSNNSHSNYSQNIIPASSRYDNESGSIQNQEPQRQNDEQPFLEESSISEDLFSEIMNIQSDENDDDIENFQSETGENVEERESHIYSGDYTPYFPTATTFMLFTWCTKHMISKFMSFMINYPLVDILLTYFIYNPGVAAYKELVKILKHEKFKCNEAPNNLASLKQYRNGLPLIPIKSHSVSIDSKQTPSTAKPFKDAYYFSVLDHIKMVLNNPSLKKEMYFGPGIEATNKTELWHGTIWQESPLFGCEKILLNNGEEFNFII